MKSYRCLDMSASLGILLSLWSTIWSVHRDSGRWYKQAIGLTMIPIICFYNVRDVFGSRSVAERFHNSLFHE